MEKILVSACLLGDNTRYDGGNCLVEEVKELSEFYEIVPFCPEMEGGLPCPRSPSEIHNGRVINSLGKDVTSAFNLGASKAKNIVNFLGIKMAILKEGSPSCGTHQVASGYFNGVKVKGMGVTASLLSRHGICCLSEKEVPALLEKLRFKQTPTD